MHHYPVITEAKNARYWLLLFKQLVRTISFHQLYSVFFRMDSCARKSVDHSFRHFPAHTFLPLSPLISSLTLLGFNDCFFAWVFREGEKREQMCENFAFQETEKKIFPPWERDSNWTERGRKKKKSFDVLPFWKIFQSDDSIWKGRHSRKNVTIFACARALINQDVSLLSWDSVRRLSAKLVFGQSLGAQELTSHKIRQYACDGS